MSLSSRLEALAARIGAEIKGLASSKISSVTGGRGVNINDLDPTAPVISLSSPPPTGPLLASYHRTNDFATYIAYSPDGITFEPTGTRFLPESTNKATNPSLEVVDDVLWVTFGTTAEQIGLAYSLDGQIWKDVPHINGMYPGGVLWAPDFFLDNGATYAIFTNRPSGSTMADFETFERHTFDTDLATASWSPPVKLQGIASGGIDLHIRKVGATYHGFFTKYGGTGGTTGGGGDGLLYHATASSVAGPWTEQGVVDPSWAMTEGAVTVALPDGGWRMYVDSAGYASHINPSDGEESVGGIFFSDFSQDFSTHGPLIPVGLAMRHIGAVQIPPGNSLAWQYDRVSAGPSVAHMWQDLAEPRALIDRGSALDVVPGEVFSFDTGEKYGDIGWTTSAREVPSPIDTVTIREPGLYMLSASVYMTNSVETDWFTLSFGVNGQKIRRWSRGGRNGGGFQANITPYPQWLNRGDTVQLVINGPNKTMTARNSFCWATVQKVG